MSNSNYDRHRTLHHWSKSLFLFLLFPFLLLLLPVVRAQCPVAESFLTPLISSSANCIPQFEVSTLDGYTILSCLNQNSVYQNRNGTFVRTTVPGVGGGNSIEQLSIDAYGTIYFAGSSSGLLSYDPRTNISTPMFNDSVCNNAYPPFRSTSRPEMLYLLCRYNFPDVVFSYNLTSHEINPILDIYECNGPSFALERRGFLIVACNAYSGVIAVNMTDPTQKFPLANFTFCGRPLAMTMHPVTEIIYLSCLNQPLAEIDYNFRTKLWAGTSCFGLTSMFVEQSGQYLIGTCYDGGLAVFLQNTQYVLASASQCPKAKGIIQYNEQSPTAIGSLLLAACSGSSFVSVSSRSVTPLHTEICQGLSSIIRNAKGIIFSCCTGQSGFGSGTVVSIRGVTTAVYADYGACQSPSTVVPLSMDSPDLLISCASGLYTFSNQTYSALLGVRGSQICSGGGYISPDYSKKMAYISCFMGSVLEIDLTTLQIYPLLNSTQCGYTEVIQIDAGRPYAYVKCFTGVYIMHVVNHQVLSFTSLIPDYECAQGNALTLTRDKQLLIVCSLIAVMVANMTDPSIADPSSTVTLLPTSGFTCSRPRGIVKDEDSGFFIFTCVDQGVYASSLTVPPFPLISPAICPNPTLIYRDDSDGSIYIDCSSAGLVQFTFNFRCAAGSYWSSGACVPCLSNTYRSADMVQPFTLCQPCPAGTAALFEGSVACDPCPVGTYEFQRTCLSCPPGFSSNVTGATSCTKCDPGHYAPSLGSTACLPCSQGRSTPNNGSSGCDFCALGHAASSIGSTICLECDAGTYSGVIGSTDCLACANGTISTSPGSSTCVPCSPGEYQPSIGKSICLQCDPGRYSDAPGSGTCQDCLPGSAVNNSAALTCPLCAPGRYATGRNAVACVPADVGYFVPTSGATGQTACWPGYVSATPGSVSCSPCLPGQYQPSGGKSICASCDRGSYASGIASLACQPCDVGTYAADPATAVCAPCTRGTASNATGLDGPCDPCRPGYYQGGIGKTTCVACEIQSFSDSYGAASCVYCNAQVSADRTMCNNTICPDNHEYSYTQGACVTCQLGYFSVLGAICQPCVLDTYTPARGYPCVSCLQPGMEGLSCSGGLASVKEGYWPYITVTDNVTDVQGRTLPSVPLFVTSLCPIGFCPGAQLQQADTIVNGTVVIPQTGQNQSDPNSGASGANGGFAASTPLCLPPRVNSVDNIFCGACDSGYVEWGDRCVACKGPNGGLIFFIILLSILLVLLLVHTSRGRSTAEISILMFFLQICALQLDTTDLLAWIRVANFALTSAPTCIAPITSQQQTLLAVMLPFILLAEVVLLAIVHKAISICLQQRYEQQRTQKAQLRSGAADSSASSPHSLSASASSLDNSFSPSPSSPSFYGNGNDDPLGERSVSDRFKYWSVSVLHHFDRNTYYSGALVVLQFSYIQVAHSIFEYLYCKKIGDKRLQFSAPTVDCDSSSYKMFLVPILIVLVLFVIGFPIASIAICAYNKDKLLDQNSKSKDETTRRNGDSAHGNGLAHEHEVASIPASPSGVSIHSSASIFSVHSSALAEAAAVNAATSTTTSSSTLFIDRYSPLFRHYRHSAWYWSTFVLLRRASFALLSVLLIEQRIVKNLAFTFMHILTMQLQQWAEPYDSPRINLIDQMTQMLMVAVSVLLTAQASPPPYSTAVQVGLFFLIVPAASALTLYIIFVKYRLIRKKIEEKRLKRRLARQERTQQQNNGGHHEEKDRAEHRNGASHAMSTPGSSPHVLRRQSTFTLRVSGELKPRPEQVQHLHHEASEEVDAAYSPTQPSSRLSLSPPVPAVISHGAVEVELTDMGAAGNAPVNGLSDSMISSEQVRSDQSESLEL